MVHDTLCHMTSVIYVILWHTLTNVMRHRMSQTIAIWVSNEPSWLVQLIYGIQNHFWFSFLDKIQNIKMSIFPFVIPFLKQNGQKCVWRWPRITFGLFVLERELQREILAFWYFGFLSKNKKNKLGLSWAKLSSLES